MMGRLPAGQNQLFYEFCIEQHVPEKHVLRALDRFRESSVPGFAVDFYE